MEHQDGSYTVRAQRMPKKNSRCANLTRTWTIFLYTFKNEKCMQQIIYFLIEYENWSY